MRCGSGAAGPWSSWPTKYASPLEVSAWEAGVVAVPSRQALLIRWHTERVAWSDTLSAARGELCDWARENAPDQYERILRNPARLESAENAPVNVHVMECGACQAASARARQKGDYPSRPDTSESLRARYWRWVERLPDRAAAPFFWASFAGPPAFMGLVVLTINHEVGFGVRFGGLLVGAAFGMSARRLVMMVARSRFSALLQGLAFGAGGLLGWSLVDPSIHLDDPRHWAAAMAVGCGMSLLEEMASRPGSWMRRHRKAKALTAGTAPRPALSPGSPDLAASLERGAPASRQPLIHVRRAAEPVKVRRTGGG